MIKITETPRDGFQGLNNIIDTQLKINYINALLKCGFDTVEVGSFVSPRAIPQMADTGEVLRNLNVENKKSEIAVLIANKKGADRAASYPQVDKIFYPFSFSSTFLKKNLNTTPEEAEKTVDYIIETAIKTGKKPVIFLSLAFGDPYGDPWSMEILNSWVERFISKGLYIIPLADTIGNIDAEKINRVCKQLVGEFPQVEFELHTHAVRGKGIEKIDAAYKAGIRHFDTVLGGLGGCPMTGKEMIANLDLKELLEYCDKNNIPHNINSENLIKAEKQLAKIIFNE